MKKAVAYARFSSDNQRQESIDAQVRAINEYCQSNKITLLRIYQDEAQSATSDQRDQFLQMIEDAVKQEFDFVVVHKLDRFARNRYDSAFYKRELRQHGVKLLSVLENLDDSPESVILESVLEGMAEYYSKNLAREVRKGQKENALKAIHNGGIPPLGYDVLNGKYVINETEAETVRMIFQWYSEGVGYIKIIEQLNALGRKTKSGQTFGKNSIYDLVRNEKYTGVYTFNRRASKKTGNRKFKDDDQIIRIPDAVPRIVSQELWDSVQRMIRTKANVRHQNTRNYLLKGYLRCGECGGAYTGGGYVMVNDDEHQIYACSNRKRKMQCKGKPVNAKRLELYVVDTIMRDFMTDEYLQKMADDLNSVIGENRPNYEKEVKLINSQLSQNKQKQQKLWDFFYAGGIDQTTFSDQLKSLQREYEDLTKRLENIKTYQAAPKYDVNGMVDRLINLRDSSSRESEATKKLLIEAFLQEIIVYNDFFDVFFRTIPAPESAKNSAATGGDETRPAKHYKVSRKELKTWANKESRLL